VRPRGLLAACAAILYLTAPAAAWNATGHRIIAAIAYERLTPATRARVDQILRNHPDYATLLTWDAPSEPAARARAVFIAASTWPDIIKSDPRFYDDLRVSARRTPLLPGFPDMARHTNWHYYDAPYAPDGARVKRPPPPHALSELQRLLREIGDPTAAAAELSYDLPWLEHIAGDVHQPLHCVSRTLRSQPNGDEGGNQVFVSPGRNLHAYWDDLAGTDTSDVYVSKWAAQLSAEHPAPRSPDENPQKWMEEGLDFAKHDVYTLGVVTGTRSRPIELPLSYQQNARRVIRERIALAGYRLAAVLNQRLK
jgi:hypothetical protein